MSQERAISKPPPKAAPSIAAIVGTGRLPVKEKRQHGASQETYNVIITCTLNQLRQTTAACFILTELHKKIQGFYLEYNDI